MRVWQLFWVGRLFSIVNLSWQSRARISRTSLGETERLWEGETTHGLENYIAREWSSQLYSCNKICFSLLFFPGYNLRFILPVRYGWEFKWRILAIEIDVKEKGFQTWGTMNLVQFSFQFFPRLHSVFLFFSCYYILVLFFCRCIDLTWLKFGCTRPVMHAPEAEASRAQYPLERDLSGGTNLSGSRPSIILASGFLSGYFFPLSIYTYPPSTDKTARRLFVFRPPLPRFFIPHFSHPYRFRVRLFFLFCHFSPLLVHGSRGPSSRRMHPFHYNSAINSSFSSRFIRI